MLPEELLVMYGKSNGGKSLLIEEIADAALGEELCSIVDVKLLTNKSRSGEINQGLANYDRLRVVYAKEPDPVARWGAELIKQIASKGKLTGRGMRSKETARERTFYPIPMCNALPSFRFSGRDEKESIKNRLRILCFPYTFKPAPESDESDDSDDATTRLADPRFSGPEQIGKLKLALLNPIVEMCSWWGVKDSVPVITPFVIAKGLCINIPMPSAVRIDAQNLCLRV